MFDNHPQRIHRYAPFSNPLPIQDYDPNTAPFICVRYNENWRAALVGAMEALIYACQWDAATGDTNIAARRARNMLIDFSRGNIPCPGDDMIILRQSPLDPCVLEQSFDNGLTWSTAFDYGLCLLNAGTNSDTSIYETNTWYTYIQDQVNNYDGTVESVNPDMVYEETGNESRDLAQCATLVAMLRSLRNQIESENKGNWYDKYINIFRKGFSDIETLIELVGFAVAIGVLSLTPAQAANLAMIYALSQYIQETFPGEDPPDLSALEDEETIMGIACCALDNLTGETPTEELFQSALTGCLGSLPEAAQNALYGVLAQKETYLAYLDLADQIRGEIDAGKVYSCPCGGTWTETFDLTGQTLPDFVTIYDSRGVFVPGVGVNHSDWAGGDGHYYRGVTMRVTAGVQYRQYFLKMWYENLWLGTHAGTGDQEAIIYNLPTVLRAWYFGQVPTHEGTLSCGVAGNVPTAIQYTILADKSHSNNCNGSVRLIRLQISGTGDNPFE